MSSLPLLLRNMADDIEQQERTDVVRDLRSSNDYLQAQLRAKDREIEKLKAEIDARTRRPSEFVKHTEAMRQEYNEREGGKSVR